MPSGRAKRKLNKSGSEKVSPREKKTKSIIQHFHQGKMAEGGKESKSNSDSTSTKVISSEQWEQLMTKIDDISKVAQEIVNIKLSLKGVEDTLDNIKQTCSENQRLVESCTKKTEDFGTRLTDLEKNQDLIALIDSELKATEDENKSLREKLLLQECYSRRENLVFKGIHESTNEDTKKVLLDFFVNDMNLANENKTFLLSRCHRLGSKRSSTRPIIARFVLDSER